MQEESGLPECRFKKERKTQSSMERKSIEHGTHPSLSRNVSEKKPYLWTYSMPKRRQKSRKIKNLRRGME
jgi:hypothetical protein